ncbi:MAG: hypothetical protein A2849_01305 [Candidatus Taylorbacteria bacterium RIFCSPHIGHO2_01_FULL_51_15]|uniref:SDR family oxidoreductase n=1 Tax=Candidatus Taylorbacteria bacterium RIFCSPHIGHO2_01_FULL_51_15 TaxID=1802304 RepID=A0A1G2M924_9BACT|nr:MAG: hypothetical protein A2849_01305 [Candidatus Taylorbacteria bacterium RIFCSPHIGHO2_01_FULL_51_15]
MRNPFDIKGRVIILTGASGFLGSGYAKFLREAGAEVIGWDRTGGKGIEAVDITDEGQVAKAVGTIVEKHGRIDALINNAAMNPAVGSEESKNMFVPVEDYPISLWKEELEVNLTGMFICIKAVVPWMKKGKGGSIINVASEVSSIAHDHRVYNTEGKYKSPAYIASKTGVVGLTRSMAAQLGVHGIRVNAFSPGGVRNEKMPADFVRRFGESNMLGRMAEPGEYNGIMQFLCSDASSFMTGANLTADGGKSAW